MEKLVSSYRKVAVITKTDDEAEDVYQSLHEDFEELRLLRDSGVQFMGNLVIVPSYLAKGLEFDAVIIYTEEIDPYHKKRNTYITLLSLVLNIVWYSSTTILVKKKDLILLSLFLILLHEVGNDHCYK